MRHLLLGRQLDQVVLIVNEFGELGIDGQILQGEHLQLIELPGGGVGYSLAGEFTQAVAELLAGVAPELILVATTGVAETEALVLDIEENLAPATPQTHGHGPGLESCSWEGVVSLSRSRFAAAVGAWLASVYRAKDLVRLSEELWLFNYVAGRWQLEPAFQGRPVLVWIGPGIAAQCAALVASVEACAFAL